MPQLLTSLSPDFLFARLHGKWSDFLHCDALSRMARGGGIDVLQRALVPRQIDLSRRELAQKQLIGHLITELWGIRRHLDSHTAAFYDAFVERYFFENLKAIFHAHFFPEREANLEFLLIASEALPPLDTEHIVDARNVNQLYRLLPAHPCKEELLPILVELEDTRDIQVAECRLAQLYYRSLLQAAKRLPLGRRREGGVRLAGMEIDLTNLVMILRNARLYHLPAEALEELCIPGGYLVQAKVLQALLAAGPEELLQRLPGEYRRLALPFADSPLFLVENALWQHLYASAFDLFRDYNCPGVSIIAFPLLKQFEVQNIIRLFEGLHFRLDAADIESMLIGVRHV